MDGDECLQKAALLAQGLNLCKSLLLCAGKRGGPWQRCSDTRSATVGIHSFTHRPGIYLFLSLQSVLVFNFPSFAEVVPG